MVGVRCPTWMEANPIVAGLSEMAPCNADWLAGLDHRWRDHQLWIVWPHRASTRAEEHRHPDLVRRRDDNDGCGGECAHLHVTRRIHDDAELAVIREKACIKQR